MSANHKHLIFFDLLNNNDVEYKVLQHAETPTSEDSARVRGEDLSTGGKALVLKFREAQESDAGFAIFVMSASRKLNTKTIKNELRVKTFDSQRRRNWQS
jgi:prolyl-tRNA editing enzyme YbaK/EbsC (Cys-tRNA(Pro) deacylase)